MWLSDTYKILAVAASSKARVVRVVCPSVFVVGQQSAYKPKKRALVYEWLLCKYIDIVFYLFSKRRSSYLT